MIWLFAAAVIVWFAIASRGFRRILAILAGVAVLCGVLFFVWLRVDQSNREKKERVAKLRIPRTNVEFVDLRMGTDTESVRLTGRVRNLDPRFTLTRAELRLRVQECPATAEAIRNKVVSDAPDGLSEDAFNRLMDSELEKAGVRCDTVGDNTENIYLDVPPRQTREIDHYVFFRGIGSPRMQRTWSYEVISISGE